VANRTYTYSVANYAALIALTGMIGGDVAYKSDDGTHWRYDGANSIWRIQGCFPVSTVAGLSSIVGMRTGDTCPTSDIGQLYYYTGTTWQGLT
jgi:hypothetical protein